MVSFGAARAEPGASHGKEKHRIVDLGCREGGFTVEFASMEFESLGVEVRDTNFACCEYVRKNVKLPNLTFVQDDVWNIERYGEFDAAFCCGLLYHLDRPKAFLEKLAAQTRKLLIIQTHFSLESDAVRPRFNLSPITTNESLRGRWFSEFGPETSMDDRQNLRWASFENSKSFWVQRKDLIGLIYDLGFHTVFEQFDSFGPQIPQKLDENYASFLRGTFIGIRNHYCPVKS